MYQQNKNYAEEIINEINLLAESNIPIIVEGRKDRLSLNKFGLKNIFMLNKPLYLVIEGIDSKTVAILTDLDYEGRKLYHNLKSAFSSRGINIDDKLRLLLFKAKVKNIESLYKMMQKWKSQKE